MTKGKKAFTYPYPLRIPLGQIVFHVEKDQLFRIHRSYAVNPSKIKSVNTKERLIFLENEESLPAAKKYLEELKKEYPDFF